MNREKLIESAALHALGLLDGVDRRDFESEIRDNPLALQALQNFQTAAEQVSIFVDPADRPARTETPVPMAKLETPAKSKPPVWLPWGLAAGLAIASAFLWLDRSDKIDQLDQRNAQLQKLESLSASHVRHLGQGS